MERWRRGNGEAGVHGGQTGREGEKVEETMIKTGAWGTHAANGTSQERFFLAVFPGDLPLYAVYGAASRGPNRSTPVLLALFA